MRYQALIPVAGALLVALSAVPARAQCNFSDNCITIQRTTNLKILTANFGYGAGTIGDLGAGTADRTMRGFNIGMDLHILGLALHELPIAVYDALSLDLTYGKMTSTPLTYLTQPEDNSTLPFTFGYTLLAGVRRNAISVLGGFTYRHYNHDIGSTTMSGSTTPLTARVELGTGRQIVLTGWAGGMTGGRVDVPFFRNLNLSATYWQVSGSAVPWNLGSQVAAKAKMLLIGFRTAEIVR